MSHGTANALARLNAGVRAISLIEPDRVFDFCTEQALDPGNLTLLKASPFDWWITLDAGVRAAIYVEMIEPSLPKYGAVTLYAHFDPETGFSVSQVDAALPGHPVTRLVPQGLNAQAD